MNFSVIRCCLWLPVVVLFSVLDVVGAADNLLSNSAFEAPLEPYWEKRTPDDATRKLYRLPEAGRNGSASVVLENVQSSYTRLRQGHDRSITVQPGSLLQLSAWIRRA